ncbi:MAG TPA: hypothetical protein VJU84_16290 [Pyrinomonadaceae bacterium]|nr:hypothetical protein [Pyrinomonadaceae bacterium]
MNNLHTAILSARVLMVVVILCLVSAATPLSRAAAPLTIRVVNNSSLEISRLYLAPANSDDWGADQLGGVAISPGVTRTINVSWDQPSIKLVGEDSEGCFTSTTVSASGELEWTITGDSPRNCGHQ